MKILRIAYKVLFVVINQIACFFSWIITYLKFALNGVEFKSNFKTNGIPVINISLKGQFEIGDNLSLNNGKYYNTIGRQGACYFVVKANAKLTIGNQVGISCAAIVCSDRVTIGNYVRIGGNTVIYDNDFHSLNAANRCSVPEVLDDIRSKPVVIEDYAFIGAHSTILKGVTIGAYSVIGAGSVVTRDVPPNQIWAGNPAKFVKELNPQSSLQS